MNSFIRGLVLFSILLLSLPLFAGDFPPCGEDSREDKELHWTAFTKLKIHAKIANVDALLCVGLDKLGPKLVVYRDDTGGFKKFQMAQVLDSRQVIINHDDLGVSIIRKGNIMSVFVPQIIQSEFRNYPLDFHFVRNLSKNSGDADIRLLKMVLVYDEGKKQVWAMTPDTKEVFDTLDLYINLGLKINKVKLTDQNRTRMEIDTDELPQAREIKNL